MPTVEDVLTGRALEVRRRFEIPVLVAALAVVPVIFMEGSANATVLSVAGWANWTIWAVFALEYGTVMWLTDRKAAYTRLAWLDVFIIIVSLPLLPSLLASTRLLRLARLGRVLRILRLVRLATVITRGGLAARAIFRKRGLGYIILITILVAMGVGGAYAILEDSPVGDSLWWAIVTMTTVGYGDMFPVTVGGRVAATVLMLLGIGFLAVLTATVAAYFVESGDGPDLDEINGRLDRVESLLQALVGDQAAEEE